MSCALSVNHLPVTKLSDDRNFLSCCLLDKCVVEQLATRVVNVIPSALIVWERCLGLFTHWLVFMHACNVAITLLKDEQTNVTVGIIFPMPQFRKRIRVAGIILGLAFQSDTFVSIRLCSFCSFLLQAFRISCALRVPLGHQSAFLCQVSIPSLLDLKIERVCVDQIHSNCWVSSFQNPPNLSLWST